MQMRCNFPEAQLNNTFTLKNSRFFLSQERKINLFTTIQVLGDSNITVDNVLFDDIYGSSIEDVAPFETTMEDACVPVDGATRIVSFKNSKMTLGSNPDKNRFTQYYSEFTEGSDRTEILYYENNVHQDVPDSIYPMFEVYVSETTTIYFNNNTFTQISGEMGGALFGYSGEVIMNNNYFYNITNFGAQLLSFEETDNATINGLTFDNITATGTSDQYGVLAGLNDDTNLVISNFIVTNSDMAKQSLLYSGSLLSQFTLTNSQIVSSKISSDTSFIILDQVKTISVDSLQLTDLHGSSDDDTNNYAIRIGSLHLDSSSDSLLTDITISNCTVGFITLEGITQTTSVQRLIKIDSLKHLNSNFVNSATLINIDGFRTTQNFQIQITNTLFQNLTFKIGGNLILVGSQMSSPVFVANSQFDSITGGSIKAEAFDKSNTDIKAHLKLTNITTSSINTQFSSFMLAYEGGQLSVYDSVVKNIYCFEDGAVLYAGSKQAVIDIYNSTLTNNTSIQGGVFIVESESVVKIHDSLITHNFAIEAGVVKAHTNGYFVFDNCTITENYALSILVGEIIDVATVSNVSNTRIFGNVILTKLNYKTSLNFLADAFVTYIDSNPQLLEVIPSEYTFQSIQGSLRFDTQTTLTNQSAIMDGFLSTLYFENAIFEALALSHPSIKCSETTLNIDSINASSLNYSTSDLTYPFIFSSQGSVVNIDGIEFESNTVPLISGVFSSLDLNLIDIKDVTSKLNLISMDNCVFNISNSIIQSSFTITSDGC